MSVCYSALQLHHLSERVLLASLRPGDRGALLGPSDLLQMHAPQVAAAAWCPISCWTDFLFPPLKGQNVLFDHVILSGSPTRRPTGRQWRPTTARDTSAVRAIMRAETNVSVSNHENILKKTSPLNTNIITVYSVLIQEEILTLNKTNQQTKYMPTFKPQALACVQDALYELYWWAIVI